MASSKFKSILALEENSPEVFVESVEVLIKIAGNILQEPANPKFRSISLGSKVVTNKLLPASGAMECLFEMGFQEGKQTLTLPQTAPLETLKNIYDDLLILRNYHHFSLGEVEVNKVDEIATEDDKITLIKKDLIMLSTQTSDLFLKKVIFWCYYVLKYESYDLQLNAMKLVPITKLNLNVMKNIRKLQLECKKKKINYDCIDYQELLLIELCNWFNTEFFTWVDCPECTKCGFKRTINVGMSNRKFPGADRVEKYKCQRCNEKVLFPRFNDPNKLLETRRGRCGEWANCFCLFAKALGWDARLVFDETDHVWIEVYSIIKSKWIHCDPCENAVDTPLMYECGWKKKLSYVFAYSKDEIQDVTWRYSCKHSEILKNRKKCSEQDLVDFIVKVRNIMLKRASVARKNFVLKRTVSELIDLMKQNIPNEGEEKGRISGSLIWRLLRGETSNEADFLPYVWKVEPKNKEQKEFVLSYVTSKDEYMINSQTTLRRWKDGLFCMKSIFRKEERDWKMVYLARTETSERGILSWKFETVEKFVIGTISLKMVKKVFESGIIVCKLCSNETCVFVPHDKDAFLTDAFTGTKTIELVVELFGGTGPNSWQHAQILRQPLNSEEATFTIVFNLVHL